MWSKWRRALSGISLFPLQMTAEKQKRILRFAQDDNIFEDALLWRQTCHSSAVISHVSEGKRPLT